MRHDSLLERAERSVVQYRLTPADARLLHRLLAGDTVRAAAAALAISVNTARYQLKQILRKTRTHRQIELLRLCLGLAPKRDGGT